MLFILFKISIFTFLCDHLIICDSLELINLKKKNTLKKRKIMFYEIIKLKNEIVLSISLSGIAYTNLKKYVPKT